MGSVLTTVIVVIVVLWACRASYRMLTRGKGGCNCTNSCKKKDCSGLPENNNKNMTEERETKNGE